MTRKDLAAVIAEKTNVKREVADRMIDVFTASVSEAVSRREDVIIRGFGRFLNAYRAPKLARVVKTGEQIHVPESRVFKFKPCKRLKIRMK